MAVTFGDKVEYDTNGQHIIAYVVALRRDGYAQLAQSLLSARPARLQKAPHFQHHFLNNGGRPVLLGLSLGRNFLRLLVSLSPALLSS